MQQLLEESKKMLLRGLPSYYEQPDICSNLSKLFYNSQLDDMVNEGEEYLEQPGLAPKVAAEVLVWLTMGWWKLEKPVLVKERLDEAVEHLKSPDFPTYHPSAPYPYSLVFLQPLRDVLSKWGPGDAKMLDALLSFVQFPFPRLAPGEIAKATPLNPLQHKRSGDKLSGRSPVKRGRLNSGSPGSSRPRSPEVYMKAF